MRIPIFTNKTDGGIGAEYRHEYPGRDVEGVNIRLWGTIGDATVTLKFKAPDNSWVSTSCTFTTTGMKNFLLKGDETITLEISGASAETNLSADIKP